MLDARWYMGGFWDDILWVRLAFAIFAPPPSRFCFSELVKKEEANDRLALGIKMNILLFLPGAWVVLFQIRGLGGMLESTAVIALIQVIPPQSNHSTE